jgi:hypothetical protein
VLVDETDDSLYILPVILAVDDGQRAGQYAIRVAEGDPYPPVANIERQTTRC